jgi:hypothetical protein
MLLLMRLSGVERGAVTEFQFCSIESRRPASEQIEVLTGLTGLPGLPTFPLSLQSRISKRDQHVDPPMFSRKAFLSKRSGFRARSSGAANRPIALFRFSW